MSCRRLAWGARRALVVLALVVLGLPTQPGPPTPAQAHHHPAHEVDFRLQVIINSIHIFDEREAFGDGEIELVARINRCENLEGGLCHGAQLLASTFIKFSASANETVKLNRTLPSDGDVPEGSPASADAGFPVFQEGAYMLSIVGSERDSVSDNEALGRVDFPILSVRNWGLGEHTQRAWGEYYDNGTRRHEGDFGVTFEVRQTPLPDLVASRFLFIGGDRQVLCLEVSNLGQVASDPARVNVRIEGFPPPGGTGELYVPSLDAGRVWESCEFYPGISPGEHAAMFTIDETREVPEINEQNNSYRSRFRFGAPAAVAPTATSTPTGPKEADLRASGIQVKSSEPSLGGGCYAGKNDVTVIVKNDGTGNAESFVVRLIVDDKSDDAEDRTIALLEAGKEVNVIFDDIRLRRGMRDLKGIADAKKRVAESNENNNDVDLTVNCRED